MKKFLKAFVITLCAITLVVGSVAATLAYLKMKTAPVENTFTAGDINITLAQSTNMQDVKMVPGLVYTVDPVVTVKANSEACWLFIKIDKTEGFDTYMSFGIADGWTLLETGVYYREVGATTADTSFAIIAGNTVTANNCTKENYNQLNNRQLDLNFTAYAVQKVGFDTAAGAWTEAKTLNS